MKFPLFSNLHVFVYCLLSCLSAPTAVFSGLLTAAAVYAHRLTRPVFSGVLTVLTADVHAVVPLLFIPAYAYHRVYDLCLVSLGILSALALYAQAPATELPFFYIVLYLFE